MTPRKHMNFDEAIELLRVGATGFTFKNNGQEIFEAVQEMDGGCPILSIVHVPAEKETE